MSSESWIVPDWPVPPNVRSLISTRSGGVSQGAYASLNVADHVGDDPLAVASNRQRLRATLPAEPVWLEQVHGVAAVDAANGGNTKADASYARQPGVVCAVLTADCLPVLFCDEGGQVVAAAHAGWRGLLAGVLEQTIAAMALPGSELLAFLGPAIGPRAFEVGDEVRAAYLAADPRAASAFQAAAVGKWYADLYALARQRLALQGVRRVFGGDWCTLSDARQFFSYRRDGRTGRMASMIWLV